MDEDQVQTLCGEMTRDGDALGEEMAARVILLGLRLSLCVVDRRKLIEDSFGRLEVSSTGRMSSQDYLDMKFECVYERLNDVKQGAWAKFDRMKDGRLDLGAEARREGGVFDLGLGKLGRAGRPAKAACILVRLLSGVAIRGEEEEEKRYPV